MPTQKVKFPFLFGKGGSPCGLYKVLKELSHSAHGLNVGIVMEKGRSPESTVYIKGVNSLNTLIGGKHRQPVSVEATGQTLSMLTSNTQ